MGSTGKGKEKQEIAGCSKGGRTERKNIVGEPITQNNFWLVIGNAKRGEPRYLTKGRMGLCLEWENRKKKEHLQAARKKKTATKRKKEHGGNGKLATKGQKCK